jgi:hypothetical protein
MGYVFVVAVFATFSASFVLFVEQPNDKINIDAIENLFIASSREKCIYRIHSSNVKRSFRLLIQTHITLIDELQVIEAYYENLEEEYQPLKTPGI